MGFHVVCDSQDMGLTTSVNMVMMMIIMIVMIMMVMMMVVVMVMVILKMQLPGLCHPSTPLLHNPLD